MTINSEVELILEALRQNITTDRELRQLKAESAGKSGILLANNQLTPVYRELVRRKKVRASPRLEQLLLKRRIRTLSGVSPIAVLTGDFGCPGRCVFCPTERGMPKSYLSNEPAVLRAIRTKFDPYEQVADRLRALTACGHPTNKVELIVMGGTFSALPRHYQTWFISRCLQALNERASKGVSSTRPSKKKIADLQKENEKSSHRLVGLTLETRPDHITPTEVKRMLALGCTRVELGVQSLDDEVLKLVKRGHTVQQTVKAIQLLKDAGLKVGLHMMPNLPSATPEKDLAMFRELFTNPDFAPDQLKIYPCVVTPHSKLGKWWRDGKYQPYSDATLTELLAEIKKLVPSWVRLSRIIRDIPAESILAGSRITNLRQILQQRGVVCHCIRCREIREEKIEPKNIQLIERRYPASSGTEVFLAFEDVKKDKLIALLRLRLPSEKSKIAYIRELHSYGAELEIAAKSKSSGQHRGYGKKLIAAAEKIAKKAGCRELKIISGIGVRPYYRKLGYKLKAPYMVKKI